MTLEIKYRKLAELKKLAGNPRTIKKADMEKLKTSIKNNKDYFEARPLILSDRTGELVIIAGNQRYEASKALKMDEVPTVLLSGLTEEREKEIIIRDNVNNGDWDMDALANEWDAEQLQEWGVSEIKPYKSIEEDEVDPVDEEQTFSVLGEIYQLGEHRVFCGSFDDDEKMRELFGNKKATCCFTDPPYNVAVESRTTGKKIQNDKMGAEEFQVFLNKAFEVVASNIVEGGGVISWMSDKELITLQRAMVLAGMNFRTLLCWVKDHFTLGGNDFQSAKEMAIWSTGEGSYDKIGDDETVGDMAVYARGKKSKFADTRKLSNVWFFDKPLSSKDHPTMKPLGLCAKGVLCLSDAGDIVFDPFLGSGSTLIACEQTGRICFGSEIDPKYMDVIRKRWTKQVYGSDDNWQELTPAIG